MRYLKHIVSIASAAALACSLGAPAAFDASAYAAGSEASSANSSAAASSDEATASSADSGEADGAGASSSAEAPQGDSASGQAAEGKADASSPEKAKTAESDAASKAGAGEKSEASKGPAASEKTARQAKDASEKSKKSGASKKNEKAKAKKKSSGERKASGEDPAKYAKKIPGLVSRLKAVPDEFGEAKDVARAYRTRLAKLDKKMRALQKEQRRAQNVLDEMQKELSGGTGATLTMVLTGRADFDSIDSRGYLLSKVADSSAQRIGNIKKSLAKLEKRKAKLEKQEKSEVKAAAAEHGKATGASIAKGNALAAMIERKVSLMRYAEPKSTKAHAALRKEALAAVADWYEFEDAMAGNDEVLTFGTGADFAMTQKAFVKKWGDAIDAFYEKHYPDVPLKGQGATMAKAAWEHKIDPRLCAAVSIVESTGGQYCIKPHNAWGWGAADDDPYNGASSWGSWAEAIGAWHDGLANSTTGLATAASVEELGEIYCSSLDWAAKVAEGMEQISAEAE